MYVYRYRHFRIKGGPEGDENGNPESLEQFFMEQPHFRVIMKAFYFEMNSQYGHDFWHEVNKKWLKYWEIHQDNINNPNYINLKGSFSILVRIGINLSSGSQRTLTLLKRLISVWVLSLPSPLTLLPLYVSLR